MNGEIPYWKQRLRWSFEATRSPPFWWPVLSWIATFSFAIVIRGLPNTLFELPTSFQDFGAADLARLLVSLPIGLLILWIVNWIRAPGAIHRNVLADRQRLKYRVREFEKRLRPNLWITGRALNRNILDDPAGQGFRIGFTVENRSDSELSDVKVTLTKMERKSIGNGSFVDLERIFGLNLPILLEWGPEEQQAEGVSSTSIPARESRWVGILSDRTVLSANHALRHYRLDSSGSKFKVAISLSARGIPSITSPDYVIYRDDAVLFREQLGEQHIDVTDVSYKIDPEHTIHLLSSD